MPGEVGMGGQLHPFEILFNFKQFFQNASQVREKKHHTEIELKFLKKYGMIDRIESFTEIYMVKPESRCKYSLSATVIWGEV